MMKRIAALLLMLCLLALSIPGAYALSARSQVGTDVSGFSSTLLDGESINGGVFGQYRVTVVCYFATWSTECLSQLEILETIRQEHPDYGVFGLLHVDATSTPETALNYMNSHDYGFDVIIPDGIWESVVNETMFLPQSFIVSREGVIVEAWQAAFSSPDILEERLALWAASVPDGDVDGNGTINLTDALIVMRCAMGLLPVLPTILQHGDMNENGVLDINDSLIILRISLGLK